MFTLCDIYDERFSSSKTGRNNILRSCSSAKNNIFQLPSRICSPSSTEENFLCPVFHIDFSAFSPLSKEGLLFSLKTFLTLENPSRLETRKSREKSGRREFEC